MKHHTTSRKHRNNISKDLDKILQNTENMTLDDTEFNQLFNEQEQILCDIKSILSNGTVTCENKIKNKLHSKKFLNHYNTFKQNYYHQKPANNTLIRPSISPNAILKGAVVIKKPRKTMKHLPHKKLIILQKQ
jgi:hypothetical protein